MPPLSWSLALSDFVRPIKTTTLSETWGLLQRHEFELRRRNGEWQHQIRETYDRGDGAGVLLCDRDDKSVILARQFRYPAFYRGENPFLIEACAGKLEGEAAETRVVKEVEEEAGLRIEKPVRIFEAFMSPGSFMEALTFFVARYSAEDRIAAGGGLADEGEDIAVLEPTLDEALAMIETGEIIDAKTIMLLYYAKLHGLMNEA